MCLRNCPRIPNSGSDGLSYLDSRHTLVRTTINVVDNNALSYRENFVLGVSFRRGVVRGDYPGGFCQFTRPDRYNADQSLLASAVIRASLYSNFATPCTTLPSPTHFTVQLSAVPVTYSPACHAHHVPQNCTILFLSELRQMSTNFDDNFQHKDGRENKNM